MNNSKLLRTLFFLLLSSLFLSACEDDGDMTPLPDDCMVDTSNVMLTEVPCDSAIALDLIAGQTILAGEVSLQLSNDTITVTFTTTGDWEMSETHLFIGNCADIPLNQACNPAFGLFPQMMAHDPPVTSMTYIRTTDGLDSCVCFVAHATVQQSSGGASETAIADGPNDLPGNRWGWYSVFCDPACDSIPVSTPDSCTAPGQFRTQTQGGWGSIPSGDNPGTYLHDNFNGAFPDSLVLGCDNTLTFSSAQAITDFLPQGGTADSLSQDYIDPQDEDLSVLAGNLLALQLSVVFDAYDPDFGASDIALGDLIIQSGPFTGWTVSELLEEANKALGACGSSYSLSEINDALAACNENFTDGTESEGFLRCP